MRKSNSLSHIPVRARQSSTASTNSNREKIRSSSIGRLSKDSLHSLKPKRTVSPDSQVKQTPLSRQRSLLKITPASVKSSSSSYSRVSPGSALIERKTIQKLSTNKIWVAKQFEKVQEFVLNSSLFDQNVVSMKTIKPPSIKVFIYIVTTLMNQLFHNVKITMGNYMEEIPRLLKTMNYPGTLTKSTLKTVNTIHSWPQVVGLFGWLIDKVTIVDRATKDASELTKDEQAAELGIDFVLTCYNQFCKETGDIDEVKKQFFKNLAETLGVDTVTYSKISQDCDKRMALKSNLEKEVQEHEKLNKTLRLKHEKIVDDLNAQEETLANREAAVEAELQYCPAQLEKLTQKENELRASVLKLEASIKVQPCTFEEKEKILSNIESMNSEGNYHKENIECIKRAKQELDIEILEQRQKLQSRVIDWNRSLMSICIRKPYLKQLLLKETEFHREEFIDETLAVAKKKVQIEDEVEKEVKEIEAELNQLQIAIESLNNELGEIQNNVDGLIGKFREFSDETADIKNDRIKRMKEWESEKEKLLLAIKQTKDDKSLKSLIEECQQLEQKRGPTRGELENLKKTGLHFFIELRKIVRANTLALANIVEDVRKKMERTVELNSEERNRFNIFLESLGR